MKRILPLLSSLLLSISALAQKDSLNNDMFTLTLEELMQINVTTASKNSEGINEAPAIISVITEREIASYGALSLVDVLNRATALYITGSLLFSQ